jgi:hypothetical protein
MAENGVTHLTKSAVKARWKKETHCHFCVRITDSRQDLEDHLKDPAQNECAICYFHHYKTKGSHKIIILN